MSENINYEYLYNRFIKDIFVSNDDFVYGIGFVGSPGMGKSTIANLISEKLNIYIIVNDKIRRMLDNLGIDSSENQSLVEKLAYDTINFMLENKTSMIIDANCLTAYKAIESLFAQFSAHCFFVKLECSEKEILKRLDYRESQFGMDRNNFSRAVREDYYTYLEKERNNPFPEEKIFFSINTEKDLNSQIDNLINKIQSYKDALKLKDR